MHILQAGYEGTDAAVGALQRRRWIDSQLTQELREAQIENGRTLALRTEMLTKHGKLLGALARGQAAIMKHFGIEPPQAGPGPVADRLRSGVSAGPV